MSTNFKKIQELVKATEDDVEKFFVKGNKAAGTRIRKAMQELKGLAQALRLEVQDFKKESDAVEKKLKVSPGHKFYTQRGWVRADDLNEDDSIF